MPTFKTEELRLASNVQLVCNDIADQTFFLSNERSIPTHFFGLYIIYTTYKLSDFGMRACMCVCVSAPRVIKNYSRKMKSE